MRKANPEQELQIRQKTLELLLIKEPEAISMREIASSCAVTATTIYYYYKDKDSLFERIKIECLSAMEEYIIRKTDTALPAVDQLKSGMRAFRDWAFEHPRIAILVMGRFKPNLAASGEELAKYYSANTFAIQLLDNAASQGVISVEDTKLESALLIAALWGGIESILLNRTFPDYWGKGVFFTDRMIDKLCSTL
ncbi:MAG TPA: TetR/AcrR family transcriptional regulator [Treponemataceae bacterium]|nr:TetR/AcrR family transcriptional regulator [Treponemataceae bacterium]HQL05709.1 TetR/AcrR family transcriptional regulator [Treponemataceae bacterium]